MSEVKVNKLSPRSGTTVTLGDSGDTITIPSGVTFDASSGGLAGTLTTAAQPNITSVGTLTSFTSTGIDDNATSTAITINSSEQVAIGTTSHSSGANITLSGQGFGTVGADSGSIAFGSNTSYQGRIYQDNNTSIFYIENTYANGSGDIRFKANGSERVTIEGTGNVGIGTSSPATNLEIRTTASDTGILVKSTGNTGNAFNFDANRTSALGGIGVIRGLWNGNGVSAITFNAGNDTTNKDDGIITFATRTSGTGINPPERMRIDSSGVLLIGKTSQGSDSVGVENRGDGLGIFTRDGNTPVIINRKTSDGTVIDIKKDGTTVGSIGHTGSGGASYIAGSNNVGLQFNNVSDEIRPCNSDGSARDNAIDLGNATRRFKDLYLGGGLYVGGTASANKLDDYEEGTWTPSLNLGTKTVNSANYVKIGRLVILNFELSNFSDTTSNTTIEITGIPFNQVSGTSIGSAAGERTDVNTPVILLYNNYMRFNNGFGVSDYATDLKYSDINNGSDFDIIGTITYFTDS
jgi:hypothetical protein